MDDSPKTSFSSSDTDLKRIGGITALKAVTTLIVFYTLYDVYQFQQSFYADAKGIQGGLSGNKKNQSKVVGHVPPSTTTESATIPLPMLTRAFEKVICPDGLLPAPFVVNPEADASLNTKIPRIVHQTGESKCLTKPFYDNAKHWSFDEDGYSFYFHNRQAKQTLLEKHWPEFPQLNNAFLCLQNAGGAAVSDLWRYLALWEYGGIYTDMDNLPGFRLTSNINNVITPDMDAFFIQDFGASPGFPSQYFFGVSPKHPLMFYAVTKVLHAMLGLDDVGNFYVPEITGPSCLDRAFLEFMKVPRKEYADRGAWLRHPLTKPTKGTYVGIHNRSVTIEANDENAYVVAGRLGGQNKRDGWKQMNMTDYQQMNKVAQNKTCQQVILEHHMERLAIVGSKHTA